MIGQREEQVRLRLPLSFSHIEQAATAFREQFHASCYLYIKGHVTIVTGELCVIPEWLPVARPDPELDLLGAFRSRDLPRRRNVGLGGSYAGLLSAAFNHLIVVISCCTIFISPFLPTSNQR